MSNNTTNNGHPCLGDILSGIYNKGRLLSEEAHLAEAEKFMDWFLKSGDLDKLFKYFAETAETNPDNGPGHEFSFDFDGRDSIYAETIEEAFFITLRITVREKSGRIFRLEIREDKAEILRFETFRDMKAWFLHDMWEKMPRAVENRTEIKGEPTCN